MVNLVAAQKPLLHGLMKMAGIVPYTVEIEPGTQMNFWIPSETFNKSKDSTTKLPKPNKPVVVLIHGFAAEGIVTWQFQIGALTKNYSVYVPDLLFFGGSITDSLDRSPKFQAVCLAKGIRKLGIENCTVVGFSYGGMLWFPDRLHRDFLEVMFNNRKERGELLEGLIVSNKDTNIPKFSQRIHLLWGENDQIFNLELAQAMKEQLGDNATFQGIKKAGHLVHLERPCVYNRCLKHFLATLKTDKPKKG
ncbi:hypothetical protein M9H77_05416 [Catharanthus roseus]|uniref:Uncharacterized protein n=1 Tax=Catharanthus roseus TaxID=4058 RepID=A0ACC0CGU4_CATRO|nr:hypothetical protein M9H77_05416 [Catharanthus roseus]